MFELSFWEMALTATIALLVFGPERLPQLARRAGYWIGRVKRQINDVRADVEREMALDELKAAGARLQSPLTALRDEVSGHPVAGRTAAAADNDRSEPS